MKGILSDHSRLVSARCSFLPTVPSKSVDILRRSFSLDDHAVLANLTGLYGVFAIDITVKMHWTGKLLLFHIRGSKKISPSWICSYLGLVDMVVRSLIRPSYSHHNEVIPGEKTEIVNRRLEKSFILSDPFLQVNRRGDGHMCSRHGDFQSTIMAPIRSHAWHQLAW